MDESTVRSLARWLGIGSIVFGVVPALAPRWSTRLFALPLAPEPAGAAVARSVGVRDAVIGMGLWSAAAHGGNFAPWLLARALCDTGDAIALGLAIRAGARDPRLAALAGIAAGAAIGGWLLHRQARARPALA
jgi:hypothetical protein